MFTVTSDAVLKIIDLQWASQDPAFLPIFQLLSVHDMGCQNDGRHRRHRAKLSDGTHHVQGMFLAKEEEALTVNSLVQVMDFMNNNIQGRNVIILLKVKLLNNPGARIGDPVDIEKSKGGNKQEGKVTK
jgi:hypothetical protein